MFVCSSYLCDVTLKSEDGIEFPCHKSVLCARQGELLPPIYIEKKIHILNFSHHDRKCLVYVIKEILIYFLIRFSFPEYFNSMLGNPWIEVGWVFYFFNQAGLFIFS